MVVAILEAAGEASVWGGKEEREQKSRRWNHSLHN